MTRRSAARRFVRFHLVTLVGTIAAVAVLNLIADPFDYFRPAVDGQVDPYKKRSATRFARANVVASGDWDIIFCGASRTEIGFDPAHPAFKGQRVYNFGLVAAKYPELWWASKFALESNPSLRTLWIELDPSYLIHKPLNGDFLKSRYGPQADAVNYGFGQTLGSLATERSFSALSKWARSERTDDYYTSLGLRIRPIRPPQAIPWEWFERELDQTRSQREAQTAAHRVATKDPRAPWLDLTYLHDLSELIDIARRQGTQVRIVIPPSHVVRLAQFIEEGWYSQVIDFKRQLAAIAGEAVTLPDGRSALEVYDFLVDDPANAEPLPKIAGADTQWHWEAGHFRLALGNRIVEQIESGTRVAAGGFGTLLLPSTVDQHLAAVDRAIAGRLPTVELIQQRMNPATLALHLQNSAQRMTAADSNNVGPTLR